MWCESAAEVERSSPRAVFAKRLLKRESSKKRCSPLKNLSAHILFEFAKSGGTAFPRPDIRMGDFLFFDKNLFTYFKKARF